MEEILARLRQLETELEALKTKERGALDLLYPTQTVTAAGGVASLVFPPAGVLPTNFKDLLFVGLLRGTKAATADVLDITVNAVAANYYQEIVSAAAAAAIGLESLAATSWPIAMDAANDPAGLFSPLQFRIFDYAVSYRTRMEISWGVETGLTTGLIHTRHGHGFINSAQAVTSVTFAFAGGNIAQNSYLSCYGVSG